MANIKETNKIDLLTAREIIIPDKNGLAQFVEDWADVSRKGEHPALVTNALVKMLSKAYYPSYLPASPGERGVLRYKYAKSGASEGYNEELEKLAKAAELPFWKRAFERRKINSRLASIKNYANEQRAYLKSGIAAYREQQLPYKLATKELCERTGISLESVYKEIERREVHFPI
jgi:hypothetical protein